MNKYLEESESDTESEADIDIHEIVRSGTFQDVKEAIARDRPRLIALKDEFGRCAIHYAAELDKIKVAAFLIAKQANINATDDDDLTSLHLAAAKGLTEMCRTLLEFQADIKLRDKNCCTALHHAVEGRYLETSTLLVKRGADINAEDYRYGRTVLHIAAEKGYTEIVTMLLIRGADMYASGDQYYSRTPLHLACIQGHIDVVRVLVKRGADVAVLSGFLDKNPLHLACENGHWECAQIIIKKGLDLDVCGNHINGSTALHICAAKNELACLQILVEHGADIEKQGRFSTIGTPLHVACTYGNAHAVNLLINLGADKNSREPTGHTPMHFACKSGHYDVAFMLIELEVDLQLRAENNKVAFDYVEVPTIKEKMLIAAGVVNARIEARLEAERVAAAAEAERRRKEQERLDLLRREEEERIRLAILRKAAFTKALRSVADISGELSALLGVAEEYPDQDINVNIIQPLTEYADESFFFAKENEYDMDSLTGTVHSHTTVGTSYAVYQLINSLSDSSALTRASLRGFHEVVHALLQWPGVNINYQDSNGNTALHNAALIGNRDIVEMLLTAGIKLTTLNHAGKVAANLAKTNYLRELIRNPALLAHQRRYQDGVLDHIFLQRKCRDGLSLTLDEARSVDRFLEYDQNIASGEQEMKVVLRESVVNTAAHLALENVSDSPSRSKSKYFKGQNNKNKHMELQSNIHTANKTTDHHHLHSILKHPESNISVPPLLMFTPDKVPPELSHLFPHSSSMIVPAHAISSLPVPAAGATDSSSKGLAAVQKLESAVADKYGPVPGAFGGSQSDFFFRSPLYATHVHHVQNNQAEHGSGVISAAGPLFLDLLTLQRGYLPTAFDTTEEWNEIKDFLWLLGYNHKPSPQKLSEHHSLQADSLVETSGHHLDSTWSQLTTAVAPDKRYYLFRLAVVMNRIQGAFTDEDGQLANSKNAHAVSAESSIEFDIDFESVGNAPERLPAIPSAQSSPQKSRRNKQSAMPPISSPVAEIKRALSAEAHKYSDTELTAGQGNKQQTHPQKEGAEAELDIDWSRIPANICRPDVYRLVRFAKLCEQFVLLVLRLYEPRDDGWPNPMTDQAGGYITQSLRYNVAYMRYYGFVTTEVEELLLNLVDLGYTACFQDPPSQQEDETSSHRRKVGFAEENTYQPVSITQSASSQSKRRNSKKAPIKQERRVPNLFLNPPRYWRLAVDSVFEVVAFIKAKAEHGYPLDAVRAHLWAHTGRLLIQQQRNLFLLKSHQRHQQQHQLEVEIGGNPSATAAPFPSTQVSSAHCTPAKPAALTTMGGDVYVSSSSTAGAGAQQLGFRRWLSDLFLSDYEAYFQHQGFRCLADFEGLTEQDCTEYFPFLKAGDLRRLTKAAPQLTDAIIAQYQNLVE